MLRRLTERHKMHAMALLRGEGSKAHYGLYDLPHADNMVTIRTAIIGPSIMFTECLTFLRPVNRAKSQTGLSTKELKLAAE